MLCVLQVTWRENNNTKDLMTWNYCVKGTYKINASKLTIIKMTLKNKVYKNKVCNIKKVYVCEILFY